MKKIRKAETIRKLHCPQTKCPVCGNNLEGCKRFSPECLICILNSKKRKNKSIVSGRYRVLFAENWTSRGKTAYLMHADRKKPVKNNFKKTAGNSSVR